MKRALIARALVLAFALLASNPATARARVVVVGLDGASWNVIDPMLAAGELPNFAALIARGVTANLRTVEPLISPVVWTSIATGRSPEAHGVTDFMSTRLRIQVPTFYERLAAAGARVGLYDVLMTWPPTPLPGGFVIPGWLRRDASTHPADVWHDIALEPFVVDYKQAHFEGMYLAQAQREVRVKAELWNALAARFDIDVGAVTFYGPDATSHRYWHGLEPERFDSSSASASEEERGAIRDTMHGVDRSLGVIVGALGPEDTLIVVSDHGFRAIGKVTDKWITRVTDAFVAAGIDPQHQAFSVVGRNYAVMLRVDPGPTLERDALIERILRVLRSYRTETGEPLLVPQLVDVAERPAGMERSWSEQLEQWMTRTKLEWRAGVEIDESAQAIIFAMPSRKLLRPLWPDGAIEVVGRSVRVSEAFGRERFTGEHAPVAIFAAAGGPIAHRAERGALSVLDVAPLVSYAAGHPIPDDLEGQLPEAWLQPAYLAAHPPERVPADQMPGLVLAESGADEGDTSGLVEMLRALGYAE